MRILLDTHIALWALTDHRNLSAVARDLILDQHSDVYFSAATVWEITIKHALAWRDMRLLAHDRQLLAYGEMIQ